MDETRPELTEEVILAAKTLTDYILERGMSQASVSYLGILKMDGHVYTPIAQDVALRRMKKLSFYGSLPLE